jgi:hypothetical protein
VADHANRLAANEARRQQLIAEQRTAFANLEFAVADRIQSDLVELDGKRAEIEREAAQQRAAAASVNNAAVVEKGASLAIAQCKATLSTLVERQKAAKAVPREQMDVKLLKQLKGEIDQAKQDLAAAEQRAADEEARKAAEEAERVSRREAAAAAAASAKAREEEDKAAYEALRTELQAAFDQAMEDDDYDAMDGVQQQLQNLTFAAFMAQKQGGGS